jgi:cutinase
MSTVTPLVVRIGTVTVRAALSTVFAALAVAAVLTGALAASTPTANAADDSCASIEVVFARGTNEAPGVGATGQAFVDALNARELPCIVGLRASRRRNRRHQYQD